MMTCLHDVTLMASASVQSESRSTHNPTSHRCRHLLQPPHHQTRRNVACRKLRRMRRTQTEDAIP
ncbi:hypothetical protein BC826DRAFT_1043694 [Russula brevipes]|nr:hypothetical protein BC826DRAFT_1043694 [Russula brevipes]